MKRKKRKTAAALSIASAAGVSLPWSDIPEKTTDRIRHCCDMITTVPRRKPSDTGV